MDSGLNNVKRGKKFEMASEDIANMYQLIMK